MPDRMMPPRLRQGFTISRKLSFPKYNSRIVALTLVVCALVCAFHVSVRSSLRDADLEFWQGEFSSRAKPARVDIVVAHCKTSIEWLEKVVQDLNATAHIYSKCGVSVKDSQPFENRGRCDHTYARYLASTSSDATRVTLFVKDTLFAQERTGFPLRSLKDVVEEAAARGFACARLPKYRVWPSDYALFSRRWVHAVLNLGAYFSYWHSTSGVLKFTAGQYKSFSGEGLNEGAPFHAGMTLRVWWSAIGFVPPRPYMPVCYGGNFAARNDIVAEHRSLFSRMEKLLVRFEFVFQPRL